MEVTNIMSNPRSGKLGTINEDNDNAVVLKVINFILMTNLI